MIGVGLAVPEVAVRRRGGVVAWTPASLGASLLAFWDAEQAATLTLAGSLVTTWADSTSNAYAATQATSGFKPVYSATSFNGRPGVTFDGTDDYLRLATIPSSFPIGTAGSEMWMLASQDIAGAVGSATVGMQQGSASNTLLRSVRRVPVSSVNRGSGTTEAGPVTESTVDLTGIHVIRVTFGGGTTGVATDGSAVTSAAQTINTTGTGNVTLGATSSTAPTRFWQGPMSVAIVTAPLSAPDAASLLAYLKARGGLP